MTLTANRPMTMPKTEVDADRAAVTVVAAATAIGLLLRLYQLGHVSFGVDEISVLVSATADNPLASVRERLGPVDPPLSVLLTRAALALPFSLETAARLPSALFGGVEIVATYLAGRAVLRRRAPAVLAACLLAVAPFAVRYSQEARYYVMFSALHLLSWWLLVRWLHGDRRYRAGFAVVTAASILTNVFAWLVLAAQAVVVAAVAWRRRDRRMPLRFSSLAALALAPAAGWYAYEAAYWVFGAGADLPRTFQPPGTNAVPLDLDLVGRAAAWLLGNHTGLGPLAVLLGGAALASPLITKGRPRLVALAAMTYLIPTTAAIVLLARQNGTYFAMRRVEYYLPVVLLLAAVTLTSTAERVPRPWRRPARATAFGVVALIAILSLAATFSWYGQEKTNWRQAAAVVEAQDDATLVVAGPWSLRWYPLLDAYLELRGAGRRAIPHPQVAIDGPVPARVLWITAAPPQAQGLTTTALNDVDRLQVIAGDRSWGQIVLPLYASFSEPGSAEELQAQLEALQGLPYLTPLGTEHHHGSVP